MKKAIWISRKKIYWSAALLVFMGVCFGFLGWDYDEYTITQNTNIDKPSGEVSIRILTEEKTLLLFSDGQVYKKYPIAVGKSETPTPIGEWNVVWKDYQWGTGFGTRWMGLNVPWGTYGIHGTNKPWSIGQFASHGCIRMKNSDVEELFEWVPIGTLVKIEGQKPSFQRKLGYQSSGPDVVEVQIRLRELGYGSGRADGILGKETVQAIKEFQNANNIEASGEVDSETLEKLAIKSEN